jgi:signal transduction histidine kinase
VRTREQLGNADLQAVAERIVSTVGTATPSTVELADGRTLRITGVPARGDVPAVLLIDDVTSQYRHDRVMREFVRNAAHQLRTPLTGIATAVEVLQSGAKESPDDRDRFLGHIERDAARLTRIARGLLVLARAQSGEQSLQLEQVELRPLLERLRAAAEPAPPGVTVEATCPDGLTALAEPSLLEEALAELLENAIAHTPAGFVRLIAAESDEHVAIDVVDSGEGVPPEHRARIFEPFYRVAESGDGFGLGLAIAAQAARAMDGELRAAEVPGGGTAFTIWLASSSMVR